MATRKYILCAIISFGLGSQSIQNHNEKLTLLTGLEEYNYIKINVLEESGNISFERA